MMMLLESVVRSSRTESFTCDRDEGMNQEAPTRRGLRKPSACCKRSCALNRAQEDDHMDSQHAKNGSPGRGTYQATYEGLHQRHGDAHAVEALLAAKQEGRLEAKHHTGEANRRHADHHAAQQHDFCHFPWAYSCLLCLGSISGGGRTYLEGCSLRSRGLNSATISGVRNLHWISRELCQRHLRGGLRQILLVRQTSFTTTVQHERRGVNDPMKVLAAQRATSLQEPSSGGRGRGSEPKYHDVGQRQQKQRRVPQRDACNTHDQAVAAW